MKETEIKMEYDPSCREQLLERCKALGFRLEQQVWEEDLYYTPSWKNFLQTDEALRVRSVRPAQGEAVCRITYKGPNQVEGIHAREELETQVEDGEILKTILERLAFQPLAAVRKQRDYYVRENVHICVDQVEGLGSYFEVEQLGEAEPGAVKALADSLHIPGARVEPRTYLEMILRGKGGAGHGG